MSGGAWSGLPRPDVTQVIAAFDEIAQAGECARLLSQSTAWSAEEAARGIQEMIDAGVELEALMHGAAMAASEEPSVYRCTLDPSDHGVPCGWCGKPSGSGHGKKRP